MRNVQISSYYWKHESFVQFLSCVLEILKICFQFKNTEVIKSPQTTVVKSKKHVTLYLYT